MECRFSGFRKTTESETLEVRPSDLYGAGPPILSQSTVGEKHYHYLLLLTVESLQIEQKETTELHILLSSLTSALQQDG